MFSSKDLNHYSKQDNPASSSTPRIIVVGPHKFHNATMCGLIEKELHLSCESRQETDLETLLQKNSALPSTLFILWDYQSNEESKLWQYLYYYYQKKYKSKLTFAVYNTPRNLELEKNILFNGISGIFYEDNSLELIKKGIKAILDGELWFSRKVLHACIEDLFQAEGKFKNYLPEEEQAFPNLTLREEEILIHVAAGKSNSEIAEHLSISAYTVKTHIYHIFKKINVPNRIQAALWTVKYLALKIDREPKK